MRNVEFISAGAGSGKTFTIVGKIVDFIKSGVCRADQIILTTFTRAAAAELLEKTRGALYKAGMYEEAINLDSAAIGTIHSISYEIVSRYWYILGLSPELRLITDETRDFYVRQSLATLPDKSELQLFNEVCKKFDIRVKGTSKKREHDLYFWKRDLEKLIDCINNFCLEDKDLDASANTSVEWLKEILGVREKEENIPTAEDLVALAKGIYMGIDKITNKKVKVENAKKKIKELIEEFSSFKESGKVTMDEIIAFSNGIFTALGKGKTQTYNELFGEEISLLEEVPDRILAQQSSFRLTKAYIDTIVSLAKKWIKEYGEFKKERRLLDFNDIQGYFSDLLEKEGIVEEIKSRYKVSLVDEFQDCSPQQVLIFKKLSSLMEKNVWVGDIKQAIYNFRGTDISVVKEVIDTAEKKLEGNSLSSLKKCWRSNSAIVNLTNSIFTKTFKETLEKDLVKLELPGKEEKYNRPEERDLQHWHLEFWGSDNRHPALASYLKEQVESGALGVSYDDIAILCRNGDEIDKYAKAFTTLRIPFKIKKTDSLSSSSSNPIISFINALIAYAAYEHNTLSKGWLAYFTEEGYDVAEILSTRLKYVLNKSEDVEDNAEEWLKDIKLLERIDKIRNTLSNQSVALAVETLVNQLNIPDILKTIDTNIDPVQICNDLVGKAIEYEDLCNNLGLGSSFAGFVEYLKSRPLKLSGNSNGVLLTTYHGSKGLEWKCVILSQLHYKVIDPDKIITGINNYRTPEGVRFNYFPDFIGSRITKKAKARIANSEIYNNLKTVEEEEAKRLLYVGMTRPKELLVTVSGASKSISKEKITKYSYDTNWVDTMTKLPMQTMDHSGEYLVWEGNKFQYSLIEYEDDALEKDKETWRTKILKGSDSVNLYLPKNITPSRMPKSDKYIRLEQAGDFADRLSVKAGRGEDATIGECIHQLLCIYQDTPDYQERISNIKTEYGVVLSSDAFMKSARNMYEWLKEKYGEATEILRETPFRYTTEEGQEVTGEIDLIYRTEDGDVLIDYKTYSGKVSEVKTEEGKFSASKYSGQIYSYRNAMEKAGFKVRDSLICYFNLGIMIRIIFK